MRLSVSLLSASVRTAVLSALFSPLCLVGCSGGGHEHHHHTPAATTAAPSEAKDTSKDQEETDIQAERAKLSPEDQRLVAAQEFCPIAPNERLGSMGVPLKVMIQDQPVFLCCKGCKKDALAKPAEILAKVEELKAKVKAGAKK